jgi:predicted nucleotidyltransferase
MTSYDHLLRALNEAGVEFIIIGGAAAVAHGASRLTEDLDIVYRRTDENIHRLVQALAPYQPYLRGAPPGLPFIWDERTVRRGLNFALMTSLGAIDLFGEVAGGGSYDDLLAHTVQLQIFGGVCLFVRLEKLIELKRAAGRPKDLETIAELEMILEERGRVGERTL